MRTGFVLVICVFLECASVFGGEWYLPVGKKGLTDWRETRLTPNGMFGVYRDLSSSSVAHYHTGFDIMRTENGDDPEPVFSISNGRVISVYPVLPFSTVIIAHETDGEPPAWSVYMHVSDISVSVGDIVRPRQPVARFLNQDELRKYGNKFGHLHFEMLKIQPKPVRLSPHHLYKSYTTICGKRSELEHYYHNPLAFFRSKRADKKKTENAPEP